MKSFSELTSASQVNNEDLLAISQTSGSGYASKKTTVKDITDKSNLNLAEEYDSTSTYAVDDYVIYESVLYKCISATTGTFDSTKWTSVVVTDEMGSGGGGGTTVIANPTGTPTDDLNTLQVGSTIYQVMGEGGGGGFGLVQSGHTVYTLTGQNLDDRVSITFDTPFPEVPNVALSLSDPSRGQYYNPQTGLGVMNLTKNGFDILIKSSSQAVAGDITIYWIATTKFSGNGIFHPTIYSLEEREIGVWKDGRPLYVKTYNVTFSSNYTDVTIDTTHEVKLLDGGVDSNANDNFIHLGYGTSQNDMCGAYEYEAGKIRFQNFYYSSRPNGWLNVYYTKSTDVAGSGSWTPQGVPAVHYSTDEQVIGTYFGETLYEKSIRNVSITSGAQWIDTGIDVGDSIVESKGVLLQTNGDILTLSSGDSGANAGINAFAKGVVTQGKWSCFFRTSNNDARGNLTLTLRYTKSS